METVFSTHFLFYFAAVLVSARSRLPDIRPHGRFAICSLPNLLYTLAIDLQFHILLVFRIFLGRFYTCSCSFFWYTLYDSTCTQYFLLHSRSLLGQVAFCIFLFSFLFNSYQNNLICFNLLQGQSCQDNILNSLYKFDNFVS